MRRCIEDFKMKNIAFFLLFFLLVSGHSNANPVGGSISGWRITSNVAQGIGAKITATKDVIINGASRAVTSSANVIPSASQVGRFMGKNLGAAAVIGAMDLLLDGVDYVMDPVNNTIQYKTDVQPNKYNSRYIYHVKDFDSPSYNLISACSAKTPQSTADQSYSFKSADDAPNGICRYTQVNKSDGTSFVFGYSFVRYANPDFNSSAEQQETKSVPVSAIGEQVINQSESEVRAGNPAQAAAVTRAVAQDMVQEAETDDTKARPIANELDKNISYPSDSDVEGEITTPEITDSATGEVVKPAETSSIAMKFPKACDWFPQACLFIDWVMTDPNVDSDMEVPEKEIEKQEIKKDLVKISGRSCPTDVKFDVDGLPFGIKINKAYSMQEICNTVEPLKYVFELITAVICALILLRV
jgi:hypothetical protein